MNIDRYPTLSRFIQNYFGEDFELWGNTIEEIFALYMSESDPAARSMLEQDIDSFRRGHSRDLDASFKAAYGLAFNPVPWGHTTASFLEELKRLLSE
ncbi:contact-dependent growth inhibition system immunity protein [Paraburkholderia caballeronis]|uniref:contact-dependent growth inhibition system immunity protein n=1 Tax=Paraburkholderia caballeronis TaxID=416943 RepID=UPI00089A65A1|nr:contact-dependent growth inhibition system immunity protein [Paraburkholderia caballeronis]SEC65055.1 hypothetical protein SAMN05445871_2601 [Paraburkholderia caballeronis]